MESSVFSESVGLVNATGHGAGYRAPKLQEKSDFRSRGVNLLVCEQGSPPQGARPPDGQPRGELGCWCVGPVRPHHLSLQSANVSPPQFPRPLPLAPAVPTVRPLRILVKLAPTRPGHRRSLVRLAILHWGVPRFASWTSGFRWEGPILLVGLAGSRSATRAVGGCACEGVGRALPSGRRARLAVGAAGAWLGGGGAREEPPPRPAGPIRRSSPIVPRGRRRTRPRGRGGGCASRRAGSGAGRWWTR